MGSISVMQILFAALFGMLLGGFYFAVLWLTVQRLAIVRRPALWTLLSLVVRMAVLVTGLYWVAGDSWQQLLTALAGIIFMRMVLMRRLRPEGNAMNKKAGYGKG